MSAPSIAPGLDGSIDAAAAAIAARRAAGNAPAPTTPDPAEEQPDEAAAEAAPEAEQAPEDAPAVEAEDDAAGGDDAATDLDAQTIEVDGKPLTVAELKAGYLRQSDYTRKTQELAEGRRLVEQSATQIHEQREALAALVAEVEQLRPDPQAELAQLLGLRDTDPAEFAARMIEREQKAAILARAKAAQANLERQQQLQTLAAEKAKLQEATGWKDEATFQAKYAEVEQFAREYGFPPDRVANISSHLEVKLLLDAMELKALKAKAGALQNHKVRTLPKVQRPGAATAPGQAQAEASRAAMDQLRTSGSRDAAAAAIAALRAARQRAAR